MKLEDIEPGEGYWVRPHPKATAERAKVLGIERTRSISRPDDKYYTGLHIRWIATNKEAMVPPQLVIAHDTGLGSNPDKAGKWTGPRRKRWT